jgi:hypothetical protein
MQPIRVLAALKTKGSDTIRTGSSPRMGLEMGLSFTADVADLLKKIRVSE